ncbi:MAG: thiol reductant ABC exporter subunit CydD [Brachymonas sp.]|nr:thiol reductant ABC exporter subunit CydD [Brachymonas sp.]
MAAPAPRPASLLPQWLRPYRARLWLALLLALAHGGLTVVQAAVLARLFALWLAGQTTVAALGQALPALAAVWLLQPLLTHGKERLLERTSLALRATLREQLLAALARLGPARTHLGNDGALSSQVLDQVDALDGYIRRYWVQQKLSVLMPLLVAAAVALYSPLAAGLMLLTAPLVPVFMVLVGLAASRKNREQLSALALLSGRFLDLLRGLPTLQRLQAVPQAQAWIDRSAQDYRHRTMGVLRLAFLSTAVLEFFASLSIALVAVYLGLGLIGMLPWATGRVPVAYQGGLFTLLLAPEFYAPLRQLGADYHDKAKAEAAAALLQPLWTAAQTPLAQGQPLTLAQAPALEMQQLHIRSTDDRQRLAPLTAHIPAGQRVAITGASGSGKSSLLAAILGFASYEGELLLNGQPLHTFDAHSVRQHIGHLGQAPTLLPTSLADNLRLPHPAARDDELWQALRQVGLADLVERLPLGFDTVLGERGQGLSGGQIQRLSLAQLLLQDAPLWLLDEPTAHLDADTAQEIFTLIERLSRGKTLLLVSHDAQGQHWFDQVLSLDANPRNSTAS